VYPKNTSEIFAAVFICQCPIICLGELRDPVVQSILSTNNNNYKERKETPVLNQMIQNFLKISSEIFRQYLYLQTDHEVLLFSYLEQNAK